MKKVKPVYSKNERGWRSKVGLVQIENGCRTKLECIIKTNSKLKAIRKLLLERG